MSNQPIGLKDIAVNSFASEALASETWESMAKYFVEQMKLSRTLPEVLAEIKQVEAELKQEYECSAMPSSWRSAKSVCVAAWEESVALVDGVLVRPKTATEREIKEARAKRRVPKNDVEVAYDLSEKLLELAQKLELVKVGVVSGGTSHTNVSHAVVILNRILGA